MPVQQFLKPKQQFPANGYDGAESSRVHSYCLVTQQRSLLARADTNAITATPMRVILRVILFIRRCVFTFSGFAHLCLFQFCPLRTKKWKNTIESAKNVTMNMNLNPLWADANRSGLGGGLSIGVQLDPSTL